MINHFEVFEVSDHFLINSQVSTHLIGFEPNELHSHNFIEFTYVLQGTCLHNYNGTFSTIKTGEAFLFVPCDKHQYIEKYSDDFLHRDIVFTYEYFENICRSYSDSLYEDLLGKKYPLHFFLSRDLISKFESIIPNIIINQAQETPQITTKVIAYYIINSVLSSNLLQQSTIPDWLTQILFHMNTVDNFNIPLIFFLKTLPLSHSYMCHEFKRIVGITMTEYYNQKKIEYANTLLRTTNLSIEAICEKIGFNNVSHFYTLFKKHYDTTPAKIRM